MGLLLARTRSHERALRRAEHRLLTQLLRAYLAGPLAWAMKDPLRALMDAGVVTTRKRPTQLRQAASCHAYRWVCCPLRSPGICHDPTGSASSAPSASTAARSMIRRPSARLPS